MSICFVLSLSVLFFDRWIVDELSSKRERVIGFSLLKWGDYGDKPLRL